MKKKLYDVISQLWWRNNNLDLGHCIYYQIISDYYVSNCFYCHWQWRKFCLFVKIIQSRFLWQVFMTFSNVIAQKKPLKICPSCIRLRKICKKKVNFSQIFLQNNNRIYVKHFWWRFVFDEKKKIERRDIKNFFMLKTFIKMVKVKRFAWSNWPNDKNVTYTFQKQKKNIEMIHISLW